MYARYIKRILDFVLSFTALTVLSPVFLLLILLGVIFMRGNPVFCQRRPGKDGKVFSIIKFRTMNDQRDGEGNLLPDRERQTAYGRLLRKTSLDELGELVNILKGDMSIVGPRPLLEEYLPYYNEREKHRHDVRPGLTGLAQISGRNAISWEKRFDCDVRYVENLSFSLDVKIIFQTIALVLRREGVSEDTQKEEGNFAEIRRMELQKTK